jgi:hypothetical protein
MQPLRCEQGTWRACAAQRRAHIAGRARGALHVAVASACFCLRTSTQDYGMLTAAVPSLFVVYTVMQTERVKSLAYTKCRFSLWICTPLSALSAWALHLKSTPAKDKWHTRAPATAAMAGRGALWEPATQPSQPVLPTPHVSGAGLGAAMYIRLLNTTGVPFTASVACVWQWV